MVYCFGILCQVTSFAANLTLSQQGNSQSNYVDPRNSTGNEEMLLEKNPRSNGSAKKA